MKSGLNSVSSHVNDHITLISEFILYIVLRNVVTIKVVFNSSHSLINFFQQEEAVASLKSLNKNDVVEVRAMTRPPAGVKMVIEAVCIMREIKPKKVAGDKPGEKINDYWEPGKALLMDPGKFLESLFKFDKDNIPDDVIKKIQPLIDNPDFTPPAIAKVGIIKLIPQEHKTIHHSYQVLMSNVCCIAFYCFTNFLGRICKILRFFLKMILTFFLSFFFFSCLHCFCGCIQQIKNIQ